MDNAFEAWAAAIRYCNDIKNGKATLQYQKDFVSSLHIRKIQVFEKTEKYSRTAGNPIIIHFTFQPYADTDFITMNFREELL